MAKMIDDIIVSALFLSLLMLLAALSLLIGVTAFRALTGAEWAKEPTRCAYFIKSDGHMMPLGKIRYTTENDHQPVVILADGREFPRGQVVIANCEK